MILTIQQYHIKLMVFRCTQRSTYKKYKQNWIEFTHTLLFPYHKLYTYINISRIFWSTSKKVEWKFNKNIVNKLKTKLHLFQSSSFYFTICSSSNSRIYLVYVILKWNWTRYNCGNLNISDVGYIMHSIKINWDWYKKY